ncbi:phosphoinositide-3-kinase [Capsaspora owczarzaki ATCC 30864]|uniref:phosphatidylinositol 3-kinase n=1 Tax=Capsaspora owczarzaki (strain ATCC 30864) TaxID=595528 RepID=A0A0D2VLN4_CAPO3|nr:phosphoinositide-3-kinase [Capsaspora owczarzaki ATCC 30864]KJE91037.1 phosphoinositide-3-kinase [Capsaspora owczarzaki ATCC 30864]|eukprot:XP_004348988.2 phosphoinositide-3-kinase [Capsaspora owczarzaki ATCC 30864]
MTSRPIVGVSSSGGAGSGPVGVGGVSGMGMGASVNSGLPLGGLGAGVSGVGPSGSSVGGVASASSLAVSSSSAAAASSSGASGTAISGPTMLQYGRSCDLLVHLHVKIIKLEGFRPDISFQTKLDNAYMRYSGQSLSDRPDFFVTCQVFSEGKPLGLSSKTRFKAFSNEIAWNEWLTLPIAYRDLPRDSVLAITVWDIFAPRRIIPIGGSTISLFGRNGTLRKANHRLHLWPYVEADGKNPTTTPAKQGDVDESDRLESLIKKYQRHEMDRIDWLDSAAWQAIAQVQQRMSNASRETFLYIEFPRFNHAIVYHETDADERYTMPPVSADVSFVHDPDLHRDNLVEAKHKKLTRNHRHGPLDRLLKPNAHIRDTLFMLVKYPPTKVLVGDEKDLLWRFRYHLARDKRALTKFLKAVDWLESDQIKQATTLLALWDPIDIDDALELLSSQFTEPAVREYAVTRLERAADDDLTSYLLQLVQAVKFEGIVLDSRSSTLEDNLAAANVPLTNTIGSGANSQAALDASNPDSESNFGDKSDDDSQFSVMNQSSLVRFLISRAVQNTELAVFLYWYFVVEFEDAKHGRIYRAASADLRKTLMRDPSKRSVVSILNRQERLVTSLVTIYKDLKATKESRDKKITRLVAILSERSDLLHFDPLPLPLDPRVKVVGIMASNASMFKSALTPLRITFLTEDNQQYVTLFKSGDDLRQDQLILQIISLMDRLLRKENLDLKLTPYKVLATSSENGLVQFVNAMPVAAVLEKHGSIQAYLRKSDSSVSQEVMDTYVKSMAGYCVITYLLGIGDRHLDNLLLSESGNLLHIDFGYILGRDPKPFPPPMKLAKEMVEGMGGANSVHYKKFLAHCYNAFLILRKSSNLILNLFTLMVDSSVPDIANEPDKAVMKVQEKFQLQLSDEQAVQFFQQLIDESVSALFAQISETIHKWAQYWRK